MADKQKLTKAGYKKLQEELKYLVDEAREEVKRQLAEARAQGDLSENEERDAKYVFFYDTEDKEENVMVMRYVGELDQGELIAIEDDEEYNELEEVLNAWEEDPKIQELKKA